MSSNLSKNEFKKKSREDKKFQQHPVEKLGNPEKPQKKKKRSDSNIPLPNCQPKKKVKTEMLHSESQSLHIRIKQIQPNKPHLVLQKISKLKKDKKVINQAYFNGQKSDLYCHLLQYELKERQKYYQAIQGAPLEIEKLPNVQNQFKFYPNETVSKTNQAYQKVKEKFKQRKSMLTNLTSNAQKDFNSRYLKLDQLLD